MKTTKRILAILTAIVLCLAPMALMVGAAQHGIAPFVMHDLTCESCGSTNVEYREYPWAIQIGITGPTATHCYQNIMVKAELDCEDCGYIDEDQYYEGGVQHPTFVQNPANGRYMCSNCNYTIN